MDPVADYAIFKQLWVVWLFVLFVGILAWVYWPGKKKTWDDRGHIPLRDDQPNERER